MTGQEPVKEAFYTLHIVTAREVGIEVDGLRKLGGKTIGDNLYTSEWLILSDTLAVAAKQFEEFEVVIRQFRVYKPDKEKLCVIDWKLIQSAINIKYVIQC